MKKLSKLNKTRVVQVLTLGAATANLVYDVRAIVRTVKRIRNSK